VALCSEAIVIPLPDHTVYVRAGLEFESRSAGWKGSPLLATSGSVVARRWQCAG
jgi:hypothetical protein